MVDVENRRHAWNYRFDKRSLVRYVINMTERAAYKSRTKKLAQLPIGTPATRANRTKGDNDTERRETNLYMAWKE